MAVIKDTEDFKNWLDQRPEESRVVEAQTLATRCALRALPYINRHGSPPINSLKDIILVTYRMSTISWVGGAYPTHEIIKYAAYASDYFLNTGYDHSSAAFAVGVITREVSMAGAVDNAVNAAETAANAAAYADTPGIYAVDFVGTVDLDPAITANAATNAIFWEMLSYDSTLLEEGTKPFDLITHPLWQGYIPDFIQKEWHTSKTMLLEDEAFKGEYWEVWTRWYEDRLHGLPAKKAFEIARSQQSNEFWNFEPKAVNQKIFELELEYSPPPAQREDEKPSDKNYQYFISYSTLDEELAKKVGNVLEKNNISYYAQFKDFKVGTNFINNMNYGMENSERLIALYTKNYVESEQCKSEWNVFYNDDPSSHEQLLAPFLVKPCKLFPLAKQIVYTPLFKNVEQSGLKLTDKEFEKEILKGLELRPNPDQYNKEKAK